VWNSGQVLQQSQSPGHYDQGSYGQGTYGQGYGQGPSYGAPQAPFGGGGSFLGTAAAAAAGMVGGSLLLNGIRSAMGGHRFGVADAGAVGDKPSSTPWSDQSGSTLARDAGVNDIGSSAQRDDEGSASRAGMLDQASNDDDVDHDSDGYDDDDGGGDDDDGGDYA
jgi:hypothetical protein